MGISTNLCIVSAIVAPAMCLAGDPLTGYTAARTAVQQRLEQRYQKLPESAAYGDHLRRLTRDPHPGGSEANAALADYLAGAMTEAGLQVERYPYAAYLPDLSPEILVALVTPIRQPLNNQEYILADDPYSSHPDLARRGTRIPPQAM